MSSIETARQNCAIPVDKEAQNMLKRIFPKLRVIQAHGRMARGTAEENVAAFAEGSYDVLLATTVVRFSFFYYAAFFVINYRAWGSNLGPCEASPEERDVVESASTAHAIYF